VDSHVIAIAGLFSRVLGESAPPRITGFEGRNLEKNLHKAIENGYISIVISVISI
jgi:hypothetical protein